MSLGKKKITPTPNHPWTKSPKSWLAIILNPPRCRLAEPFATPTSFGKGAQTFFYKPQVRSSRKDGELGGSSQKTHRGGGLKTTKIHESRENLKCTLNWFKRKAWRFFLYRRAKIIFEKKKLVHLKGQMLIIIPQRPTY